MLVHVRSSSVTPISPDVLVLLGKLLNSEPRKLCVCRGRRTLDVPLKVRCRSQDTPVVVWDCHQGLALHWRPATCVWAAELAPAVQPRLSLLCLAFSTRCKSQLSIAILK